MREQPLDRPHIVRAFGIGFLLAAAAGFVNFMGYMGAFTGDQVTRGHKLEGAWWGDGGAYIVARDNLGRIPSLVAGASGVPAWSAAR